MATSKNRNTADWNGPIRTLLALMFGASFCAAFLFSEKIAAEAFTGLAGLVIGWFFRSKEDAAKEEQVKERVADTVKAILTPPPAVPNGKGPGV